MIANDSGFSDMEEEEEEKVDPWFCGLHLSEWRDCKAYEKAYLSSATPALVSISPTLVKIYPRQQGEKFLFVIQVNTEIRKFLKGIEKSVFFSPSIYTFSHHHQVILPISNDDKLFVHSFTLPPIFNEDKKRIDKTEISSFMAKVKLSAQCICKNKEEMTYRIFFNLDQLLVLHDGIICAWD